MNTFSFTFTPVYQSLCAPESTTTVLPQSCYMYSIYALLVFSEGQAFCCCIAVQRKSQRTLKMSSQHMTSLSRQRHMMLASLPTTKPGTATHATMNITAALVQMTRVRRTLSAKCTRKPIGPSAPWSGSTHGTSREMLAHGLASTRDMKLSLGSFNSSPSFA